MLEVAAVYHAAFALETWQSNPSQCVFFAELVAELRRREKEAGITPDPVIDAYMKAAAIEVSLCVYECKQSGHNILYSTLGAVLMRLVFTVTSL